MKKLKKLALWLMMMVLVFSLSACGEKEDDDSKSDRKDRVEEREDDDEDDKDSKEDSEDDFEDEKVKDAEETRDSEDEEVKDAEEARDSEDEEVQEESKTIDADELIEQIINQAGQAMTQSTANMEIEMSMSVEGVTLDLDMVFTGKNLVQMNPYMAYSTMEMTMTMAGQQETVLSESYVVAEDGNLVTYTYDGNSDYWVKMETGMTEAEIVGQQEEALYWIKEKPKSDFIVDTQLYDINGKDAYRVEFTITGEEMNQSLNGMTGVTDLLEESGMGDMFDMSSLDVPTIYYIDAETYQIIQMEMSMEGMGEWMNDMMSTIMSEDPTAAGYQMNFDIGKCYAVYSDISYEPVEVPALPAEATETTSVLDMEDIETNLEVTEDEKTNAVQPEDGVYTIEESGAVAKVTCPEGWTVLESAYDQLYIENEETWQEAEFVMYVDVTREDFVSVVEEMIVPELQTYNVYISHGMRQEIGAFETMEVLGDGLNFYFAWAPVDNGWIMVTVTDYDGLSLEEALVPILDLVDLGNVL